MITVFRSTWALLLGLMLLMVGNGLQGTVLGVRGNIEGYSATTMSWVMAAYFLGFLGGSRITPLLIRRVGHVRVFAALASTISAAFILYGAAPNPYAWSIMRLVVGFCFSGVYVVAESWLNNAATNETRGKALSLYLIVQMVGIVAAQGLLLLADPAGWTLFVVMSVCVSISFLPILLTVSPAPLFDTTKPMSLKKLFQVSPLGMVGVFLLGGVFSALFGMAPVYAIERSLELTDISIFIGLIYLGGMLLQYPLGWLSDRMDRRVLITIVTASCTTIIALGLPFTDVKPVLFAIAFLTGGIANPLYSLLLAYTNDFLDHDDMAAASGGMIFVNGIGAVSGPFVVGYMMTNWGSDFFFVFIATLMGLTAVYGIYRMTQRPAPNVDETSYYAPVLPQASPVAVEVAQEVAIDRALEDEEDADAEPLPS